MSSLGDILRNYGGSILKGEFRISGKSIDDDLTALCSDIRDHFDSSTKSLMVKITNKRTLSANAIVHVWCKQVSEQTGDDVKSVFARVKRDFGLPILLADPEHGAVADYILKQTNFWGMPEDKQLILIDAMEVTRKLSTRQHNDLRDNMQSFYNQHGFNLQYMEKE